MSAGNLFLPALGATGLVLSCAILLATANRDRQELATAEAAIVTSETRIEDFKSRVERLEGELEAARAEVADLRAAAEAGDEAPAEGEEVAALPETVTPVTPSTPGQGNVENGKKLFAECSGCHKIGAGAENGIGPHLNLLFGRKAASVTDFRYSDSLIRAASNGLEWHADTLSDYIEDPRTFASGTRMSYDGMKDAADRRDLLAFLRTYSDNPADIPEADPTAVGTDHTVDPEILTLVGDAEYGEYLSSECTTCHQASGGDDGIPSIVLWPEEDFVTAMHAYRDKVRPNQVMQLIAGRLSNEEIAALAAYFKDLEE